MQSIYFSFFSININLGINEVIDKVKHFREIFITYTKL